MASYLKYIKQKHLKKVAYSPFQMFLMLVDPSKSSSSEDIEVLLQMIENTDWCASKITKAVLSMSQQLVQTFRSGYLEEIPSTQLNQFTNTFRLLEQFINQRDLKELYLDYLKLAQNINDYFEYQKEQEENKSERETIMQELDDFYKTLPSPDKPLRELLNELPIQVFLHISAADGTIHSRERARFLEIVNNPDWCEGACTRIMFTGSAYFFKDMIRQYVKDRGIKDIVKVKRTVQLMDRIFKKEETDLVKKNLLRLSSEIAKSCGGIGGFASISKSEKIAILQLQKLFEIT